MGEVDSLPNAETGRRDAVRRMPGPKLALVDPGSSIHPSPVAILRALLMRCLVLLLLLLRSQTQWSGQEQPTFLTAGPPSP